MRALTDQTAVVTGAASGIGRGIADVLAAEGARVVIADVGFASAERVAEELKSAGHDAMAIRVDVSDRDSMEKMAAAVCAQLDKIDILAANAGIYPMEKLEDIDDHKWDRVMDVNVKGALHAVQACLPSMLKSGYGRIVLTSSITGPINPALLRASQGSGKPRKLSDAKDSFETTILVSANAPSGIVSSESPSNGESQHSAEQAHRARGGALASCDSRSASGFGPDVCCGLSGRHVDHEPLSIGPGHISQSSGTQQWFDVTLDASAIDLYRRLFLGRASFPKIQVAEFSDRDRVVCRAPFLERIVTMSDAAKQLDRLNPRGIGRPG